MPLHGSLSNGDGLAQAVKQPFEVGHTLPQFGDLLIQGGKSLAEFLTLGGEFGADGSLPAQNQPGQGCSDRKDGYTER